MQADLTVTLDSDYRVRHRWGRLALNVHASADLEVSYICLSRLLLD